MDQIALHGINEKSDRAYTVVTGCCIIQKIDLWVENG